MSGGTTGSAPTDCGSPIRPRFPWGGSTLALVAVAITAFLYFHSQGHRGVGRSPREALAGAVGGERVLEGRLTGGFSHGPRRTPTRSLSPAPENLRLLAVAGELQKAVEANPTAEHLWSFGVAQLLLGRYDQAIRELDDAIALAPSNPLIHSDAASARLARAETLDRSVEDIARAIDEAERALTADPKLIEGLFNKAVALERAGLTEAAVDAWTTYLAADAASPWAAEATGRLAALRARPHSRSDCVDLPAAPRDMLADAADRCPQEAREQAERLLADWAGATIAGHADAAQAALAIVKSTANRLVARGNDRLLLDAVTAIERAGPKRMSLARGHLAFERGRGLYDADQRLEAAGHFRQARTLLRTHGSVFWIWAQQSLATVHTHRRELNQALSLLAEIDRLAAARNYRAVRARTLWLTGVATLQLADPSRALQYYHRAGELFEQLGEAANVSNVMNAAADSERILGDLSRGWQSLSTALRQLNSVGDPTRRYLAYYNASLFAHRAGLEYAALHYQRRALLIAKARKGPAGIVEASINLAGILGRLGRIDEADAALGESTRMLTLLDDAQPLAYMTARIAATRGEFLRDRNPQASIRELDAALGHFASVEPAEAPRLLLLRGQALARSGNEQLAIEAYVEGTRRFEERRRRLQVDRQRVSYADEGWELYRQLVEAKVKRGEFDEALATSDRGRSRALAVIAPEATVEAVRNRLGPGGVLVYYAALENELHAWVITSTDVRHHRIRVAASELQSHASAIARAVGSRSSTRVLDGVLRRLYDAVIAPLAIEPSAREIVIVPDGALRTVPFAALRGADGTYLIQRSAVAVAGSLVEIAASGTSGAPSAGMAPRVLIVGEPLSDRERWPQLAALPFSGREAEAIARFYARPTVLTRAAATKAALLVRLADADVFHFAGHAVANEDFPELSRLLLSSTPSDDGELLAEELERSRLRPGSTVVLSACSTGVGPVRRASGVQSLAQAFLAKGAGAVIAASWDVEDYDTSELMTAFHQHLAGGQSAASALRAAQVAAIETGKPVSAWAGFTVFGGAASWRHVNQ
jgi:CHAT domain-containing protein/tetratricopeptide (TPR) repeat protein